MRFLRCLPALLSPKTFSAHLISPAPADIPLLIAPTSYSRHISDWTALFGIRRVNISYHTSSSAGYPFQQESLPAVSGISTVNLASMDAAGSGPAGKGFIGAIDQGTTSTRFFLYDEDLNVVGAHQMEFTQIHPQAGWVEHNPMEILDTVRECMSRAVTAAAASEAGLARGATSNAGPAAGDADRADGAGAAAASVAARVKAVGLTNQRETTVVWSKSSGKPLHNALVWMDTRTSAICKRLESQLAGGRAHFRDSTGLPISSYFSAVKLLWLMENVPAVKEAVDAGDALFGTIDTWIIWNMTGGPQGDPKAAFVTDCTNAARTMLMDLKTLQWHQPTLDALGIPPSLLPRIISNADVIGPIAEGWPLVGVPLAGCLGDQHAAMVGQRCGPREAKATYGTGCFILLNTGPHVCPSAHGLLSTLAFKLGKDAPVHYALEGSIAIAGAAVQWLRDSMGIISKAAEVEGLARQVENTGGVYFVPAFREDARGVLVGISRYTTKAHIARAVLESICFQVKEVLDAMHTDAGTEDMANEAEFVLRVDGGAAANDLLLQLQANTLGCSVVRPASIETTALGAALAAGIAVGLWDEGTVFSKRLEEEGVLESGRQFTPAMPEEERKERFASWVVAVERSYGLASLK